MIESLKKYKKPLKKFAEWYGDKYSISLSKFLDIEPDFQIGIFLKFLEEVYNIGIIGDKFTIMIFYQNPFINGIIKSEFKHGTELIIEIEEGFGSLTEMYISGIIKTFKLIEETLK